ncbi:MAG: hypothetical protein JJT76_13810 [Clostridiaceae bacterium]|nr:hypothetical protein [Clostridiaceae bacterium]
MQLMYSPHCLVRNKEGEVYYFYLNQHKEVCYDIYKEDILLKKQILISEMIIDFSAAITVKDELHLICITQSGKLMYYFGSDQGWNNKLISNVDIRSNIYSYLMLFIKENHTHIFCMKTNLLNSTVSSIEHIYWNEKQVYKSTLTSYMPGKYPSPYQVQIDSVGNIHIVYKALYKTNHQLYYNKFNISSKKWLPAEIISDLVENHSHPHILIDKKDNLHLVWCTIEKNNFILKYKRKSNITNQRNKWSNPQTLSSENANYLSPILIQEGTSIKVLCRQNNHIAEIVSEEYGHRWILCDEKKLYKVGDPLLIRYTTNYENDKILYNINHAYGKIDNSNKGIELFGVRLLQLNKNQNLELRNTNVEKKSSQVSNHAIDEVNISPKENDTEAGSDDNNEDYKSTRNIDSQELLEEIQNHINTLILELKKLNQFKNLLQKKPLNSSQLKEEDCSELKELYNNFKNMESNISNIEEEKVVLQEEFNEIQSKFTTLDNRITLYKEEFLILQQQVDTFTNNNLNFIERIKGLFK